MASVPVAEDRPSSFALRRRTAARGETIALWVFFAVVLAFYYWIIRTSYSYSFTSYYSGPYGQLGDAFLHGQLNLRLPIPSGLLSLPNPYDGLANQSYRIQGGVHDLTLWHGKLYLYWGPVPTLLFFAPAQLLGLALPEPLVAMVLGFGGTVFSVLTLRFLVRRFLPATPWWALWLGMVSLALCNVVPFILRRAAQYEIAIAGGLCFGFLALWLLSTGWFRDKPSLRRLAGASLALGLAIGCRPTAGLYGLVPLVLVVGAWRSGRWPAVGGEGSGRRRIVVALFGPVVVCGLLLLAYNMARFGTPLEFGQKYQLAAADQTFRPRGSFSYLPPGLFFYLLAMPRPLATFPFLQLPAPPSYPWGLPADYTGVEMTVGLLPMVPLVAALVFLPFALRRWEPDLRRFVVGMTGVGVLMILALGTLLWGTSQRYEVDFVSLLLIPALLVWYTALNRPGRRSWGRKAIAVVGAGALFWGSLAGLAESCTSYYGGLMADRPAVYNKLTDAFSPLSRLIVMVAGGPRIAKIDGPSPVTHASLTSLGPGSVGFSLASTPVTLTVASPARKHYLLRLVMVPAGNGGAPEAKVALRVSIDGQKPLVRAVDPYASKTYDIDLGLSPGINRVVLTGADAHSMQVTSADLVAPDEA